MSCLELLNSPKDNLNMYIKYMINTSLIRKDMPTSAMKDPGKGHDYGPSIPSPPNPQSSWTLIDLLAPVESILTPQTKTD